LSRPEWKRIDALKRVSPHQLRLYVAGSSPRSIRAIQNVKQICEAELPGCYELEVIDIYKEPLRAVVDQIVAIPTLIKRAPGELRRMIGDMSETAVLRRGLGLSGGGHG
jgi:circadian clock protein KaiB